MPVGRLKDRAVTTDLEEKAAFEEWEEDSTFIF